MARAILNDGTAGFQGTASPPAPRLRQSDREPAVSGADQGGGEARRVDVSSGARAFTAIELMVVIAIILILVGMLVPTISGIRSRARKQTAATRLKGICIALDRHFLDRGFYPRDTGRFAAFADYDSMRLSEDMCQDTNTETDDPYSLYKYLCGPGGQGVEDTETGRIYGPYIQFDDSELRDESTEAEPCNKIALDPWGRPWVYEEHRSISRLTKDTRDSQYPNWKAHNKDRYDIYSVGPDGIIDSAAKGMHNGIDDDVPKDGLVDEADEARYDGRDNDDDGKTDERGEVGNDITNW